MGLTGLATQHHEKKNYIYTHTYKVVYKATQNSIFLHKMPLYFQHLRLCLPVNNTTQVTGEFKSATMQKHPNTQKTLTNSNLR